MLWLYILLIALFFLLAGIAAFIVLRSPGRLKLEYKGSVPPLKENSSKELSDPPPVEASTDVFSIKANTPSGQVDSTDLEGPPAYDGQADFNKYLAIRRQYAHDLIAAGRYESADQAYLEDLLLAARLKGMQSEEYIDVAVSLAQWLQKTWRPAGAEKLYAQLLDLYEKQHGINNVLTIDVRCALAETMLAQGKAEQAVPLLEVLSKDCGFNEDHSNLSCAVCCTLLSQACYQQSRHFEALRYLLQAMDIQSKLLGVKHPVYIKTLLLLAGIFHYVHPDSWREFLAGEVERGEIRLSGDGQGDSAEQELFDSYLPLILNGETREESRRCYERALALLSENPGQKSRPYLEALTEYADLLLRMYHYKEADECLRQSLEIGQALDSLRGHDNLLLLKNYAEFLEAWGRYSQADALYLDLLKSVDKRSAIYPSVLRLRANMFEKWNRLEKAELMYREYLEAMEAALAPARTEDHLQWEEPLSGSDLALLKDQWHYGEILEHLCRILVLLNRFEEAKQWCLERIKFYSDLSTGGDELVELSMAKDDLADLSRLKDKSRFEDFLWDESLKRAAGFGFGKLLLSGINLSATYY